MIYVTTAILTILIVPVVIIIKVLINTLIHDKITMKIFIAHDQTAKNMFYETVHRKV